MSAHSYHCLDFRRDKLADPKRLSYAAQTHASECALCQAFARRIDNFEAQVADALSIPVPDGLAERVILRTQSGRSRWQLYALAASVLLALAVTAHFTFDALAARQNDVAMVAVNHVLHEPESFTTRLVENPEQFKTVLANFGGQLQAPIGAVRYIRLCPIEGHGTGWHIVYETDRGMVTLLLIPAKDSKVQTETVTVEGMNVMVKRAGDGFYALIANTMDGLKAADEMLNKNVRWKT
ncbi:MAG TPA: DUF3379 family protein [Rhodocyclaceae bacterium]|nr:DUF3379 family protein [Rhodocyclaceae bacterium]